MAREAEGGQGESGTLWRGDPCTARPTMWRLESYRSRADSVRCLPGHWDLVGVLPSKQRPLMSRRWESLAKITGETAASGRHEGG